MISLGFYFFIPQPLGVVGVSVPSGGVAGTDQPSIFPGRKTQVL
jgi:hypothetical protein